MPWTPEQVRRHKAAAKAVADINHSTLDAVDNFSSSIETLLVALSQRPMTPEQLDRLASILEKGWRELLSRSTSLRAMDRQTARAARATAGSRKAA